MLYGCFRPRADVRLRAYGPGLICLLDADNGICIQLIQWITKLIRRLPFVIRRTSRGHLAIFEPSLGSDVRFWPGADTSASNPREPGLRSNEPSA